MLLFFLLLTVTQFLVFFPGALTRFLSSNAVPPILYSSILFIVMLYTFNLMRHFLRRFPCTFLFFFLRILVLLL